MNARESEAPRDNLGRELKVGDVCVYPVRRGSSMWLNRFTIQRISERDGAFKLHGVKGDGYPVAVTSIDRVALIGRDNVVPFMEIE